MQDPFFSIIISSYNQADYIEQCIRSCINQTYKKFEIIVIDNFSDDGTDLILNKFKNEIICKKIHNNDIISKSKNLGITLSKGKWLAFLDTDDYWFKEKLSKQIEKVNNSDFILCYAGVDEIDESGKKIRSVIPNIKDGYQLGIHLNQFNINMVTPIISNAALKEFNIKFDKLIIASEEYNIFLKLACVGKFCTIKEVLGVWRIRRNSLTSESYMFWYKDRRRTLDSLKDLMPDIEKKFPKEYNTAYSTSIYYEARSLIISGNKKKAIYLLKSIRHNSKVFFMLWLISYSNFLWKLIHKEYIKRKISNLFSN